MVALVQLLKFTNLVSVAAKARKVGLNNFGIYKDEERGNDRAKERRQNREFEKKRKR
jgi:hypothetical protein